MKRVRKSFAALAALVLVLHALAPAARAFERRAPEPATQQGVYAAIACGLGVRLLASGGAVSGAVWGVTFGACAWMIWDALNTPD